MTQYLRDLLIFTAMCSACAVAFVLLAPLLPY